MAPPEPADTPAVTDRQADLAPTTLPAPNAEATTTPTASTTPAEGRTTRSRSEPRGQRLLTCKTCRFTCNDSQEFTHHQNTAHAEGADKDTDTASSQRAPGRTRSSARLKRAASSDAVARNPAPAKKVETSASTARSPGGGRPDSTLTRRQNSAPAPREGQGLKIRLKIPTPITITTTTTTTITTTTTTTPSEEPAPPKASDEESADIATRPVSANLAKLEGSPEQEEETREETQTPEDPQSSSPPPPPPPAEAGPSTVPYDNVMISTNGPGPVHNDLNASACTSSDEDMSEEGGRLVIDDSTPGGSSGSGVIPTRCGNIQNRTYSCDDCDFTTTSAKENLLHKKEAHGYDFSIYSCNLCDYATKYKQKLPRHRKLHFSGSDTPAEGQIPENMMSALDGPLLPQNLTSTPTPTLATSALTPTPMSAQPSVTANPTHPISTATPQAPKRSLMDAGLGATPSAFPAEILVEEGEEEEEEEEEVMESDSPNPTPPLQDGDGVAASAALEPPAKKKRKDVSPNKYFEVAEEVTYTKYGCAKCGNVYKWKKSLNKHWKEKHGNDPGDSLYTPPGMLILLQQNNHVQTEHRRCCHKTFLEQITVKRPSSSRPHTPPHFLNGHYNGQLSSSQEDDVDGEEPLSYVPASIPVGPFCQPVFPSSGQQRQSLINNLHAPIPSSSCSGGILDLSSTNHTLDEADCGGGAGAFKPLDFSLHKPHEAPAPLPRSSAGNTSLALAATSEEDKEVSALNELQASSALRKAGGGFGSGIGGGSSTILKCPKCGEVLKTQTAYSNHMAMHLQSANKRVAKCGVCQTHFPNNEALNLHFMERHMDHITSHKEAIQKIPHGLQQTYHLLKMPLHNISKLSAAETDDPLKCNMCEFTAKWPAELQKHAVSHSDERPFVCMVCGSTYKWKWDLVKHFEKAHSNLPNPYKRREGGAPSSTVTSGALESQGGLVGSGNQDYEMEEGEVSMLKMKDQGGRSNGAVPSPSPSSFLFEQTAGQADSSVENILRASHEANLMMSRQPNFLDSPEHTMAASYASPQQQDSGGERGPGFDLSVLQGVGMPPASSGLPLNCGQPHEDGLDSRAGKHGPMRNPRGQGKDCDPFSPMGARHKLGGKGRGPYRGYRTVVGSESSDLKYQCLQCEYKARWPSEIMQHMKNHSTEKPYGCPYCTYRSKWKWDVVKHLKRCGKGGTIKDVIDYNQKNQQRGAPPNVTVTPQGSVVQAQQAPSPTPGTSSGEDSAPAGPGMAGDPHLPVDPHLPTLPAAFLTPVVSAASAATTAASLSAQDYVSLIYQRSKAASEAITSAAAPVPGTSASNGPDPAPPSQPEPQPPVVYSSIHNDGQHYCLHCTFIAGSLAELRRHQVLHSDEKPFTCDECSYSTKWKCDMKKHKEKYKHYGPIRVIRPTADGQDDDKRGDMHKCPHCPFQTRSLDTVQSHIKAEHPASRKSSSGSPKFRCKRCPFSTNELGDFISHRNMHRAQTEDSSPRQSPSVNGGGAKEVDEARVKHPRKRMSMLSCSKCDFKCLKSPDLLQHQEQEHGAFICPFCSQRCDSKDAYLDHLVTHPDDFKPKEWECFFYDENNEEDVNNNNPDNQPPAAADGHSRKSKVMVVDTGSSANTIDLTATPIPTPALPSPHPLPKVSQTSATPLLAMHCQWCDARFANVVRLYRHVSEVHPSQKRQQEIAEGLKPASPPRVVQPGVKGGKQSAPSLALSKAEIKSAAMLQPGKGSVSPAAGKVNGRLSGVTPASLAGSMSLSLLQAPTIIAQLGHHGPTSAAALVTSQALALTSKAATDMGLNLSTKKLDSEKQAQVFQCMECPFKTIEIEDYLKHIPTHKASTSSQNLTRFRGVVPSVLPQAVPGSRPSLQDLKSEELRCWFCPESSKNYLELYVHMQTLHLAELVARQDKCQELVHKVMSLIQPGRPEMSHKAIPAQAVPLQAASLVASPPSAGLDPSCVLTTTTPPSASTGIPAWLHQKRVEAYRGTPLSVIRLQEDDVWFKCLVCNVMERNPEQIAKHARHVHHSSMPMKFQCDLCGDGYSEVQAVMQHHQVTHPSHPPSITMLVQEEIVLPAPRQPALRENFTGFSPSALAGESASGYLKRCTNPALVPTPVIKKERASLSPPQASSSPANAVPMDYAPLDLSTDAPEDRSQRLQHSSHRASDSPRRRNPDGRRSKGATPRPTPGAEPGPGEEDMEVEAAAAQTPEASKAGEDEDMPEFRCKHCPYTCRSSYQFRTHCRCHGVKGRFQCDHCSFSHAQLTVVSQHRAVHASLPAFNPIYVPKLNEPRSSQGANNARNASPAPPPAPLETLRCQDCPFKTTDWGAFNTHVSMHGGRSQYICDFCDWSADRLTILVQHRGIHASDPDFDPSPEDHVFANPEYAKVVSGEFEAKLLDSKSPGEEQARSSSPEGQSPPFRMSICKKSYSCPRCPFVTPNRLAYDFHLSQHDGSGCFPCDQCSYRTQHWSRLCQHNRLHEEHQQEAGRRSAGLVEASCRKTPPAKEDSSVLGAATTLSIPAAKAEQQHTAEGKNSEEAADSQGDKVGAQADRQSAEFPDRETARGNSGSPASADVPSAGRASAEAGEGELQCERCPFHTPSRLLLNQHGKHHSGSGAVRCPWCDYTCPSREVLLQHSQLHFPALDPATLQHMVDSGRPTAPADAEPTAAAFSPSSRDTALTSWDKADGEAGSPAGQDVSGGERSAAAHRSGPHASPTPTPTRVYACRYCEREFEDKELMKQHERQHKA
ncbi:hypothetical protein ACOMHN_061721 [Nucella lapillus]